MLALLVSPININKLQHKVQAKQEIRGIILKFWSWHDISVTSNATCLKIKPNNNVLFVDTPLWNVSEKFYVTWKSDRNIPRNSNIINALTYQADWA